MELNTLAFGDRGWKHRAAHTFWLEYSRSVRMAERIRYPQMGGARRRAVAPAPKCCRWKTCRLSPVFQTPHFRSFPATQSLMYPSNDWFFGANEDGRDPFEWYWGIVVYSPYDSTYEIASNGGGPFAPSNGPSYSHADVCAASTVLNKGGATFLDALGIIPGEGNLLAGVQAGAGLISAGMAVFGNDSTPADFAFSGAGLGLTLVNSLKTIGGAAGKAVPIAGNLLSVAATRNDIKGMNAYYNDCMAGKN